MTAFSQGKVHISLLQMNALHLGPRTYVSSVAISAFLEFSVLFYMDLFCEIPYQLLALFALCFWVQR